MSVLSAMNIVHDWLGEGGKPVDQTLSNHRALICTACPHNLKSANFIKKAIAQTVKQHLEVKHKMKIETEMDADLHLCEKCGCSLPLKVHVPIEHMRAHTTDAKLNLLPDYCWIRKESYARL